MGYLLADSLGANLTFLPLAWLTYSSIFWARGGRRVTGHKRCVRKTFCVHAGVIAVARETHQSESWSTGAPGFKGLWQSQHQIWESWYRHRACTQRQSQARCPFPCKPSYCRSWQCFGWGLSLKNTSTASAKTSATDRCTLPPWSVTLSVWYESKHFCFPSPRGERCWEVKLASYFFWFCLRASLLFLTATRPQDNRGVILVTHHKSSSNIKPPAKMTLKWAIMTTLFFLPPSYPSP